MINTTPLDTEYILQNRDTLKEIILDNSVPTNTCRLWQGDNCKGYGIILIKGRKCRVNRVLWIIIHGVDPYPLYVLHSCDTPSCIDTTHHFLGDGVDNMIDKANKGREPKGIERWNSKLTDDIVRQIRIDCHTYTQSSIAEFYNISHSIVSDIHTGKRWKHVI